jgi:hypothetical protein
MLESVHSTRAIETGELKEYFFDSISRICERRSLESSDSSIAYIVNLLCHYVRSEQLFDWDQEAGYDIRPLALLYGEAMQAKDQMHRLSTLRRLGDVALFISGMFNASLSRKPVGLDYYINMGGGAYGWLSDDLENSANVSLNYEVFRELSERFQDFVGILDEFADGSSLRGNKDLISLYELWLESKDPRVAEKIKQKGIAVSGVSNQLKH